MGSRKSSNASSEVFSSCPEQCIRATSWQEWVKCSQKLQRERIACGPEVISAYKFRGNLHVSKAAIEIKEKADKVAFY